MKSTNNNVDTTILTGPIQTVLLHVLDLLDLDLGARLSPGLDDEREER